MRAGGTGSPEADPRTRVALRVRGSVMAAIWCCPRWVRIYSDFRPFATAEGWDLVDFEDTLRSVVPNLFWV
jgi:hypothetical protein